MRWAFAGEQNGHGFVFWVRKMLRFERSIYRYNGAATYIARWFALHGLEPVTP
jgi:hypothetical protein